MEDKLNDLMNDGDYYSAHQLILSMTKRYFEKFKFRPIELIILEKSKLEKLMKLLNLLRMELLDFVKPINLLVPQMLQCQFLNMRMNRTSLKWRKCFFNYWILKIRNIGENSLMKWEKSRIYTRIIIVLTYFIFSEGFLMNRREKLKF